MSSQTTTGEVKRPGLLDSLRVRNYRIMWFSQVASNLGDWFSIVALTSMTLRLGGGPVALGVVGALQFAPTLIIGLYAGVLVDRSNIRRVLFAINLAMVATLGAVGALVLAGAGRLWMVYVCAAAGGAFMVFDGPARSAFLRQLVDERLIHNAVVMNILVRNLCRALGSALGGVAVAAIGVGPALLVDASSFAVTVVALVVLNAVELSPVTPVARARRQLRDGMTVVRHDHNLAWPLTVLALVSLVAYNFTTMLPLVAEHLRSRSALTIGLLFSAVACGTVLGALHVARSMPSLQRALHGVALTALGCAAVGLLPGIGAAIVGSFALGIGVSWLVVTCNAQLQIYSPPTMRGRVMAMFGVALGGSAAVGNPLVGLLAQHVGIRTTMVAIAVVCTAVFLGAYRGASVSVRRPEATVA